MEALVPASVLLNADSPRSDAVRYGGLTLKPHQAAALQRCLDIEAGRLPLDAVRHMIPTLDVRNASATIAALCLGTGHGKSATMLALCLCTRDEEAPQTVARCSHAGGKLSYDVYDNCTRRVRTNLIVVPHGVMPQWTQYVKDVGAAADVLVYGRQTVKASNDLNNRIEDDRLPLILLCSSTCYLTVVTRLADERLRVRRLIIDEADTIPLGNSPLMTASMTWAVTASLDAILTCDMTTASWYGRTAAYQGYGRRSIRARHVRDSWAALQGGSPVIRQALIVRATEAFVRESSDLEDADERFVLCAAPAGTGILHGLIDDRMMQALNTDDVALALSYVSHKGDSGNIVDSLTQSWTLELRRIEGVLLRMGAPDPSAMQAEADFRNALRRQADALTSWIMTVQERVDSQDLCPICYDAPTNKCVMQCCSAPYCFECAAQWVSRRGTCPSCRKAATKHTMHVVTALPETAQSADAAPGPLSKKETCVSLVDSLLAADDGARVLVCCSNSAVFDDMPAMRCHGVAMMKGSGAAIRNTVDRFARGECRVMCVASDCYSSGINLPMVTDVVLMNRMDANREAQVIGRAQRPGRTSQLKVWYLVQTGEAGFEDGVTLTAH